jgi:glutathione synthase
MKIAFIVNDIQTERANYSTTHLAFCAHKREHEVYYAGVGDLAYYSEGHMGAMAKKVPDKKYRSAETFLKAVQDTENHLIKITDSELDVILLRNDPSDDQEKRPWAMHASMIFGQIALKNGVIVLNDPKSLSYAINKMYFQHFPEVIRPKTIITRNNEEIKNFFQEQNQKIVLKPLQGSGGKGVFLVDKKSKPNLNQMIEAISRDGFIIAQEYLPDAKEGDIRLFVVNGKALEVDGKYCALRRVNAKDDVRSNIHAGGVPKRAKIDESILELVDIIRPKLLQDGMFMVGLDIVGNKLMEINVFSPGGLNVAGQMEEVDFVTAVIEAIENKVRYKATYGNDISNKLTSTL